VELSAVQRSGTGRSGTERKGKGPDACVRALAVQGIWQENSALFFCHQESTAYPAEGQRLLAICLAIMLNFGENEDELNRIRSDWVVMISDLLPIACTPPAILRS
jgi:hypothetical protein